MGAIVGVGLATVSATLFRPFAGTRTRWVLLDLLLIFIVLSATISEVANRTLIPGTIFELLRFWIFPYLLGRLCVEAWPEMKRSLPIIVLLATILGVFAIVESLLQVNLLAVVRGKKWDLLDNGEGFRWGLEASPGSREPSVLSRLVAGTDLALVARGRPGCWSRRGSKVVKIRTASRRVRGHSDGFPIRSPGDRARPPCRPVLSQAELPSAHGRAHCLRDSRGLESGTYGLGPKWPMVRTGGTDVRSLRRGRVDRAWGGSLVRLWSHLAVRGWNRGLTSGEPCVSSQSGFQSEI